ncbi:hypothetical protein PHMEG_00021133 [Phytophthora megakarya]|uniref:Jacalin-type lectin domain-containing protein n=1 Tax=Phytophthora megakarya TaxID=4795 RepID=A0A225VNJ0_9STRA|nr:hypothetical protein PHMEG_00021133 [Phytophthora megakarya]
MFRFFIQVLASVTILTSGIEAQNELGVVETPGVKITSVFGASPVGIKFTDQEKIDPGQIVKGVTIRAGERLDGVGIILADPTGAPVIYFHGGDGGDPTELTLGPYEIITSIEAHIAHGGIGKIAFIEFGTNASNYLNGGTPTSKQYKDYAPEGYQLGGFYGTDNGEIVSIAPFWTSIKPLKCLVSSKMYFSEELYPAGTLMTDIFSLLGIVKGVRIKSGERIDGVGIILEDDMGKPSLHYHGGIGGESYTLWLDEGEHITSMKAHLGGEDGRTRIYYLEFSTNLNNVISSGTRTDRTVNSTAPEGYQVGGFHGSSGKELDSVGIIWTSIERMQ